MSLILLITSGILIGVVTGKAGGWPYLLAGNVALVLAVVSQHV